MIVGIGKAGNPDVMDNVTPVSDPDVITIERLVSKLDSWVGMQVIVVKRFLRFLLKGLTVDINCR